MAERITDEGVILAALDMYARKQEELAELFPEGSSTWADCIHLAQRANQLYTQHLVALERPVTCPHCGYRWTATANPAECPRCREPIDEAA